MAAPVAADGDVAAPGARVWVPISETPAGAPPEDDDEALPFTLGVVQRRRPEDAAPPSPDMVLRGLRTLAVSVEAYSSAKLHFD